MILSRDRACLFLLSFMLVVSPITGCGYRSLCNDVYVRYIPLEKRSHDRACDDDETYAACVASLEPAPGAASFFIDYGILPMDYLAKLATENRIPESRIIEKYGPLLMNESVMMRDKRIIEILLRAGISPFEGEGHIAAAVGPIVWDADREIFHLIEKYYPKNVSPQSAEISAYLEDCQCGKLFVDELACWDE